jgi:Tfp pilus assembly protein PilF
MASAAKPDSDARASTHTATWTRHDTLCAVGVAALAMAVRVLYLAGFRHSVYFDHPVVNAAHYDRWALQGYPAGEPFYQAPLYIAFLEMLYGLGDDAGRFWTVRVVQALTGAGTAVLACVTARSIVVRLDAHGARLAGLVAGGCCALAAPLVYFDGEMLPGSLTTLLLGASLALLVRAVQRDAGASPSSLSGRLRWVWPALLLGLAVTNQPNVLVPVFGLAVWLLRWRRRTAVAFLLVALVPVAGVTLWNAGAHQGFVLVSTNYGDNLLLAHNPEADGLNPFPPAAIQERLDALKARGLNQVQRAQVAAADARAYIGKNPGRSIGLWFKKAWLFYNQHEIPNNRSIRRQTEQSAALRWPPMAWVGAGVLLPLGLAGIVCAFAAGVRAPLAVIGVGAPLSFALFLVCARYRAPYLPLLAVLAGLAVARFVSHPPRRELLRMLLALGAGAFVAWPNWYGVRASEFVTLATNEAKLYRDVADAERRRGNAAAADSLLGEARIVLERAETTWPHAPQPRIWLGDLYLEQADGAAAEQKYRQALAVDPRQVQAFAGLARIAQLRDDPVHAIEYIDAAIAIEPENAQWQVQRGAMLYDAQRFQAGVEAYERALQILEAKPNPGLDANHLRAQVHLGRGMVLARSQQDAPAEAELRQAIALEPANSRHSVQLARLLVAQGRLEEALQIIQACLDQPALRPVERAPLQQLLAGLRQDAERGPGSGRPRPGAKR